MRGKSLSSKLFGFITTLFLVVLLFSLFCIPAAAAETYTNSKYGVQFTVPDGWNGGAATTSSSKILATYIHDPNTGEMIFFSCTTSHVSDRSFTKSVAGTLFKVDASLVEQKSYNGISYFETIVPTSGLTVTIRQYNGYIYTFYFGSAGATGTHRSDFESLMNTVTYTAQPKISLNSILDGIFGGIENTFVRRLLSSLLMTFIFYSLPIIIYRFAIRRRPMSRVKAKNITTIYSLFSFALTIVAIYYFKTGYVFGCIIFWTFVNHIMLSAGYRPELDPDVNGTNSPYAGQQPPYTGQQTGFQSQFQPNPPILKKHEIAESFCPKCGSKRTSFDPLCPNCGNELD